MNVQICLLENWTQLKKVRKVKVQNEEHLERLSTFYNKLSSFNT